MPEKTFTQRMLDQLQENDEPWLRMQIEAEDTAAEIYREAAQELREEIESGKARDFESRERLSALRERVLRLLVETQVELEDLVEETWGNAVRVALERTDRALGAMRELSGLSTSAADIGGADAFIRAAVKHLSDEMVQGLSLSDRVWRMTSGVPAEILRQVGIGIANGEDTAQLGRRVYQYLANPEGSARQAGVARALRTRAEIAAAGGNLDQARKLRSRAAQLERDLPSPGRGVYRSPAKNAQRLVRTEAQKAERKAMDDYAKRKTWAVGVQWVLDASHPRHDICDALAGVYRPGDTPMIPHPHCLCHRIPVPDPIYTGETVKFKSPPPQLMAADAITPARERSQRSQKVLI